MGCEFLNKVKSLLPNDYDISIRYVVYLKKTIITIRKGNLEVKCFVNNVLDMQDAESIAQEAKEAIEGKRIGYVSDAFGYPAENKEVLC